MNFYQRHIGDFARDTAHLSQGQIGAYDLLLDFYYASEKPLPLESSDLYRIARAFTREEQKNVAKIISTFFTRADDGYVQKRVQEEIEKANLKKIKAQASANARWGGCERNANALPSQCLGNAHQTPDTRQEEKEEAGAPAEPSPGADDAPPPAPRFNAMKALLPDYVRPEAWAEWVESRRASRKPVTEFAARQALRQLDEFRNAGHDPNASLTQSARNGWQGLFPPKNGGRPNQLRVIPRPAAAYEGAL